VPTEILERNAKLDDGLGTGLMEALRYVAPSALTSLRVV